MSEILDEEGDGLTAHPITCPICARDKGEIVAYIFIAAICAVYLGWRLWPHFAGLFR